MPSLSLPADRQNLRRVLRAKRRALSPFAQKKSAQLLAHRLARLACIKNAERIALYWPVDGEIDARVLQKILRARQHHFYLPVLQKFPADTLAFARWYRCKPLHKNRFSIPEPVGRPLFFAQEMDVILLPLTGFDAQGNRLGMGGGFYDRTLATRNNLKQNRHGKKPLLIGIAHACQQVPALVSESWDVPLDMIVTDQKIFRI
jgi:5-formyltetrahydrofolate cyclo-ligase